MEAEGGQRQVGPSACTGRRGQPLSRENSFQLFAEMMLERMHLTNIASMLRTSGPFEGELIAGDHARVSSRIARRRGDASVEYGGWIARGSGRSMTSPSRV
jgi:hypothetical protein